MSNQIITSDLLVELSTEEQQLIAGGQNDDAPIDPNDLTDEEKEANALIQKIIEGDKTKAND